MDKLMYTGFAGKMKDAQSMMNKSISDLVLLMSIESDFNEWFEGRYKLKFMPKWVKIRIEKVARAAYLEGHKLNEAQSLQSQRRRYQEDEPKLLESQPLSVHIPDREHAEAFLDAAMQWLKLNKAS